MWSSCPAWVAVIPDDIGSDGVKSSAGFSFNIVADSPAGPETGDNLTDLSNLPDTRDINLELHVLILLKIQKHCIFTNISLSHTHK